MKFKSENITSVKNAFDRHGTAVAQAFSEYRACVKQYDGRYAADYAAQKKTEARRLAATAVDRADRELHDAVGSFAAEMRKEIRNIVINKPDYDFLRTLDTYRKHGLTMTEGEVRALASFAADCYLEMRVLQSVAQKSGFKIQLPSVDDIENDIKRIEKAARVPSMYAPSEYVHEAGEVLGEKPYFTDDGKVYQRSGKADALYLTLVSEARNRLEADLETVIPERWTHMAPVRIEPFVNSASEGDKAEECGEEDTKAVEARVAEEQAARERYAESLDVTKPDTNADAITAHNAESELAAQAVRDKYFARK